LVILSVAFVLIAFVLFSIYACFTSYVKDYREIPQSDEAKLKNQEFREQNEESKV
jgi:hypothetical protein